MSAAPSIAAAPRISVIVPAYNRAETLGATLDSLACQTEADWEAIVVDDGSADQTFALASAFAERDPRVRVLRQDRGGVSAARNTGLSHARGDWVLFLDADDTLECSHLARLYDAHRRRPEADVVCGGWRVARPQGLAPVQPPIDLADVFRVAAARPPFVIHAALTRRSRLQHCGGFDESLASAEDWDLWQRIARTGATFAPSDAVAQYSFRADSLSNNLALLLKSGLAVIERGHGPDPRVADPAPRHAQGASPQDLAAAKILFSLWVAGVAIGAEQEDVLPQVLAVCRGALLGPAWVASVLVEGVARATAADLGTWMSVWPSVAPRVETFLEQLQAVQLGPQLARRTLRRIEVQLANSLGLEEQGVISALQVVICERSLRTGLRPARGVERVRLVVRERKQALGRLDVVAEALEPAQLAPLFDEEFGPSRPPERRRRLGIERLFAPRRGRGAREADQVSGPAEPSKSDLTEPRACGPSPGWVTLTYHRVADEGAAGLEDYRVAPQRFAEQMSWLADQGYVALSLEQLEAHVWEGAEAPPRAVLITFDDGYSDVLAHAAPAMERYGFVGSVFLVTEEMGATARWDAAYGEPARLMDWAQAEALRARGWSFGAHSARHRPLTALAPDDLRRDLAASREAVEGRLGRCTSLAYPYGDIDEAVARASYAAGFRLGFTCEERLGRRGQPALLLPRLTALGGWSGAELGAAIGGLA